MAGDAQHREDKTWREVRHYAYVDRPFAEVGQLLASAPERVVGHPGEAAAPRERLSDLHVRRAGIDMSRDVQITIGGIVLDEDAARLGLRWEDARRPKLFPVLEAALELAPLTAGRHDITQVGLVGRYRPPFGRLGTVADTLAGRRVVMESVERFIDDLAERIEAEVPPAASEPETVDQSVPEAWPSARRRRVFLPVDGLERRPGGAVALRQRLTRVPGVSDVEVDAVAEMAVVDYDATVCGLTRLLNVLEEDSEADPAPSGTTDATI
jgi:copper chaperone CopZ